MEQQTKALLSSLRVLDLTEGGSLLCGKVLGDLGADVIKIERPGGGPSRNIGPFYHDIPDPEKSLFWFAYGANKRGITLDIETTDGKGIFKRLVKTADIVIESFPPGYLSGLGLGYDTLSEVNPQVILTSITPFGQTGPYKDYKGPDIVSMAMGGYMFLTGDPDRAPVRISFPQADFNAAGEAVVGTMIALYYRGTSGLGQHVDAAAQVAMIRWLQNSVPFWVLHKVILKREGPYMAGSSAVVPLRGVWRCKDGFVAFTIFGGAIAGKMMPPLLEWMEAEGMSDEGMQKLKRRQWAEFDMACGDAEVFNLMQEKFAAFFLTHTKSELYEGSVKRNIMLAPVATAKDHLEDKQLKARGYWVKLEHPELGTTLTYPGAFCKASEISCSLRRRAPLIGEHNLEIYQQELGFPTEELVALKQGGVI